MTDVYEVTEFDEMANGMNEGSVLRCRTRGDALVLVKLLAASHDEGQTWIENFADAIVARRKRIIAEKGEPPLHVPPTWQL